MQEALKQFPITIEIPVQWGDMDAARHVNNLFYLRWGESARITYFEKMDLPTSFSGKGPILGWQDCKYIFPMTFPDTAIIGVKTTEILDDKFIMECAVFSKRHNRIAAISSQSIVPYNYLEFKKIAIPNSWIENIERLDNVSA